MSLLRIAFVCVPLTLVSQVCADHAPQNIEQFIESNCYDCHDGKGADGGLDLRSLSRNVNSTAIEAKWLRVIDRVAAGEMPPPDTGGLTDKESSLFTRMTSNWIRRQQTEQSKKSGRVPARRLTNLQLERSLQHLLGIDLPLADQMTTEPRNQGFTTVAEGQSLSHFQLEQHLRIVDLALDEAFRRALTPSDVSSKKLSAKQISRTDPKRRCREPELIAGQAVTWSGQVIFYGRLPATTAKEDGWYRFTIQASALKPPKSGGVWCSIRSGRCVSSAPLLNWVGSFQATKKTKQITVEAWLGKGDMLEVRPADQTLPRARFEGGQVGPGEGGKQDVPGLAIDWIQVERFYPSGDDDAIRRRLFGNFQVKPHRDRTKATLVSENPRKDISRLVMYFGRMVFRRPATWSDLQPYVEIAQRKFDESGDVFAALQTGYRALFCSSRFLYLQETPGALDDFAIAARLSYMLRGTTPDRELLSLAVKGQLRNESVLREQTARLLDGDASERFIQDFAAEWLDLDLIDFTMPDRRLYPGFDILVQQSMLDETHRFLVEMLRQNLPVTHLIDSDYTYLNERLARYYGIDGPEGDSLERVLLKRGDPRGGLLTQGAIMKVTANGTTTSPVIRGVWVSERLLGQTIPPPPENIPAIEPDIRGAKSIREMLGKHLTDTSCASCHRLIDPPGYALENFDPSGRWRDTYGSRKKSKNKGVVIDASFKMPDGRDFRDLDGFKRLVVGDPERLAANVAEKLLVYGTGAPIRLVDRAAVDEIVGRSADDDYGFHRIIEAVVTSSIFLTK